MAIRTITLQPIQSGRQSYFSHHNFKNWPAADQIHFYGGWNLEVPNHWEVNRLFIKYKASAVVANRYVSITLSKAGALFAMSTILSDAITAGVETDIAIGRITDATNLTTDNKTLYISKYAMPLIGNDHMIITTLADQAGDTIYIDAEFRWLNVELGLAPNIYLPVKPAARKRWFW